MRHFQIDNGEKFTPAFTTQRARDSRRRYVAQVDEPVEASAAGALALVPCVGVPVYMYPYMGQITVRTHTQCMIDHICCHFAKSASMQFRYEYDRSCVHPVLIVTAYEFYE